MANGANGRPKLKIVLIAEGQTEGVFLPYLKDFVNGKLAAQGLPKPKISSHIYNGRIPTEQKLKRVVYNLLESGNDHVFALTDVYTGTTPPDFKNAADAKAKMRGWVGPESRFHPHAAQYDFEAWLLPYWPTIRQLAKADQVNAPWGHPETVNHGKPPARRLRDLFETGKCRDSYVKPRDAKRILQGNDLGVAIQQCAELRELVNTLLSVCGINGNGR